MNVTNNLKLPQYTEEDIFDLQDINKAYDSIDKAYKEVIDFKNEIPKTNATAEVIDARGGKETLGERLNEFDEQLEHMAKNINKNIIFANEHIDIGNGNDDSVLLNSLITSLNGKSCDIVFDSSKTYYFANTVFIPYNVGLDFGNAYVSPKEGGTLVNGFMFYLNANASNGQLVGFSKGYTPIIKNIYFTNPDNVENVNVFYSLSKHTIDNILIENSKFKTFYKRDKGTSESSYAYNDMIILNKIKTINNNKYKDENFIEILWLGDSLRISDSDLHQEKLYIEQCSGGVLENILNAHTTINKCNAMTLTNFHNEDSSIIIKNSSVSLNDSIIFFRYEGFKNGRIPLSIIKDNNQYFSNNNKHCSINNVLIAYDVNMSQLPNDYTSTWFDARINCKCTINGFYRISNFNGESGTRVYSCPSISFDGVNVLNDFSDYPSNAIHSIILGNKIIDSISSFNSGDYGSMYMGSTGASKWKEASGTYYYFIVYLWGNKNNMMKSYYASGELSISVTYGGACPLIGNKRLGDSLCGTVRLYRGTSPNTYTHYVDIPITSFESITDLGFYVSTGDRWNTRVSGTKDDTNSQSNYSTMTLSSEGNSIIYGTAIPTHGTWKKGDKIINSNPTAGGYEGWVCINAGTPGTWKGYGLIQA
jgi:hypothetical protein|nr:MAG TPA: hypothetical protein [Caudoviricetes sp.]